MKYLWVDRLCIDQDNPEEKHYLISKMGLIYEGAELTIIAADGMDSNCGLPGVGNTTREIQPKARVNGLMLVSSLPDPRNRIRNSIWSTRGWTYQEGVLSRRRLVFTKEQLYFECGGMVIYESIHLPLLDCHTKNKLRMERFIMPGIFEGKSDAWLGFQTKGVTEKLRRQKLSQHIKNYTQRELSFETDSLLAFHGISTRYCLDQKTNLRLIYGLPVWTGKVSSARSFTLSVVGWAHTMLSDCMDPRTEYVGFKRCRSLPSWTWAGWRGAITCAPGDGLDIVSIRDAYCAWNYLAFNPSHYYAEICFTSNNGEVFDNSSFDSPQDCYTAIDPVFRIDQPYIIRGSISN